MGEVKHFINGKNFKDYGVHISQSDGLFDILKIKNLEKYDWKEYHGHSVNLDVKKTEARIISLKGFIVGDDWKTMRDNFYELFSELDKKGTQRYMIEPFGMTPLFYEVYRENEINLVKRFRDNGQMVGVFDMQLIEPNPKKRILKINTDEVNLKIIGETVAEIFWGNGTKTTTSGNFFENYSYITPDFSETSEIPKTATAEPMEYEISAPISTANYVLTSIVSVDESIFGKAYLIGKIAGEYEVIKTENVALNSGSNLIKIPFNTDLSIYERFVLKVLDDAGNEITGIEYLSVNLYNANTTDKPTVIGEKVIIIAGNIEELTIETDAEVLWTEL